MPQQSHHCRIAGSDGICQVRMACRVGRRRDASEAGADSVGEPRLVMVVGTSGSGVRRRGAGPVSVKYQGCLQVWRPLCDSGGVARQNPSVMIVVITRDVSPSNFCAITPQTTLHQFTSSIYDSYKWNFVTKQKEYIYGTHLTGSDIPGRARQRCLPSNTLHVISSDIRLL